MRVLIGALAAALLAGCASSAMDEARLKSPNKAFSSNKPENVVAQCVQFAWQDESVFGVDAGAFLQPGKTGGFTVYTRGAESFTDVQSGAAGTVINYYAASDNSIAQRRLAALATCL
ncbi:hypothetical protein NVV94_10545 [Pseudomonas sp. LS1212]|uniref:hypothetical protein n=1 Tax=Pseudomonas sp. LS1212 TaxID=2972478 RepID=UPI00215D4D01|nr:hypothetical protein [Pseudomonas sp. LS1212]UVJ45937.1 hypothetical protein NVV94_10545 [Pseudomonas sp. LS1212]